VQRGRRSGYKNFSQAEQMLLCSVIESALSLGKTNWERVAQQYNADRLRGAAERDYESLRRKFRSLYGKAKPTGINGEIPASKKSIAWAQEIQVAIELKAGAHTAHDESDQGDDDAALLAHVGAVTQARSEPVSHQAGSPDVDADGGVSDKNEGGSEVGDDTGQDDDESQADSLLRTRADEEDSLLDEMTRASRRLGSEDATVPGDSRGFSRGSIARNGGQLPVEFAQDVDDWGDEGGEDTAEDDGDRAGRVDASAATGTMASRRNSAGGSQPTAPASEATPALPKTSKSPGRPKKATRELLSSTASPDGPTLSRAPGSFAADTEEASRRRGLASASNRLGGRDLRVLRDNFEEMGGRVSKSVREKHTSAEVTGTTNYAAAKRIRARKRMETIEKELTAAEAARASGGADILQLLVVFREEAERKADAGDKRRREEREERRELEQGA
jgi:hypothetical protein